MKKLHHAIIFAPADTIYSLSKDDGLTIADATFLASRINAVAGTTFDRDREAERIYSIVSSDAKDCQSMNQAPVVRVIVEGLTLISVMNHCFDE